MLPEQSAQDETQDQFSEERSTAEAAIIVCARNTFWHHGTPIGWGERERAILRGTGGMGQLGNMQSRMAKRQRTI